ncbi:MAG: alanine racemase [Oscillibacter sp.]
MVDQQVYLDQLKTRNSFYLYEEAGILAAAQTLQASFPGAQFLYSMKCNPHALVLKAVFSQSFGADAASLNEVLMARKCGVPRDKIYFSAPGRTEADLRRAVEDSVVIADSLHEIDLLQRIAAETGAVLDIGLRINPDFTFVADHGVSAKFGVDEEQVWEQAGFLTSLPNLRIVGIHVHSKSQELSAAVLENYHRNMFALARRVQERLGVELQFVNFGSGLGIPFAQTERALDVAAVGSAFQAMLAEFRQAFPKTQILIESGRYVVGKSGVYATKVLDKKVSRGKTFLIFHDTLNGFARPAITQMVLGFTQTPFPWEPLFTCKGSEELIPLTRSTETETVTLAGNLCTGVDVIAKDITLPKMDIGDGLLLTNAGCYAAVMTPMQFASLTPPAQLFLTADGQVKEA